MAAVLFASRARLYAMIKDLVVKLLMIRRMFL